MFERNFSPTGAFINEWPTQQRTANRFQDKKLQNLLVKNSQEFRNKNYSGIKISGSNGADLLQ